MMLVCACLLVGLSCCYIFLKRNFLWLLLAFQIFYQAGAMFFMSINGTFEAKVQANVAALFICFCQILNLASGYFFCIRLFFNKKAIHVSDLTILRG